MIIDSSPVPMALNDELQHITLLNKAFVKAFGYTLEDIPTLADWWTEAYPDLEYRQTVIDVWRAELERTKQTGTEFSPIEVIVRCKSGMRKTLLASSSLFYGSRDGSHLVVLYDITERKQTEEALLASKQIIEGIFNAVPFRVFWKDRNLVYLGCNAMFARDAGFADPKDIVGKDDYQMGWRDQAELYRGDDRQVIDSGCAKLLIEEPQTTSDGNSITLLTSKIPLRNSNGEISGVLGAYMDITGRKQAEEALQALSARQEAILASIPEIIMEVDCNKVYTWANQGGIEFFGDDVVGKDAAFFFEGEQETYGKIQPLFSGDEHVIYLESLQRRKDGEKRLLAWWCRMLKDAHGHVQGAISTARDITERKQAEAELREKEVQFRNLANSGTALIWASGPDKLYNYFNEPWLKFTGRPLEQEIGNGWTAGVHPDELDRCLKTYITAFDKREAFEMEYRLRHAGGEYRWLVDRGTPNYNSNGEFIGYIGHCFDITERKQLETYRNLGSKILEILNQPGDMHESIQHILATLKTMSGFDAVGIRLKDGDDFPYFAQQGFSNDFMRTENTLIERTADGGVCRDKDGNISLECTCGLVISGKTDPASQLFTRGGSCWTNDSFPLLELPSGQDPRRHPRNECIHQGYASVALIPIRTKDQIVGLLHFNDRRKGCFSLAAIEQLEGIAAHIGEALMRHQTDEALREREKKYSSLFNSMLEGFALHEIICDASGKPVDYRFLDMNPAFEKLTGLKKADTVGKTILTIFPETEYHWIENYGKVALNGDSVSFENYSATLKRYYDVAAFSPDKNQFAVVCNDITDRKKAEAELVKAKEKAEESDRLKSAFLSNMSHEIRTPMNGIMGFTELLKEPHLSDEDKEQFIHLIEVSSDRMLNTINDIIDISRVESGQMEVLISATNINEQIEYIYAFFKHEMERKGLQLLFKNGLPKNAAVIKTDKEKLYGILTNLVKNAIKFTEVGTIEFGYEYKDGFLEFYVKDSGIGIPKERQEAIFERFVQADIGDKRAYQGSGLGLSIAKAYVEMLCGKIWVESEEGRGSVFYFTIPYNTEPEIKNVIKKVAPAEEQEKQIKDLKILVAEDDEQSEMLITITVKTFSKVILKARTGVEAVAACRNYHDIDLVIMDIAMPEMSGYEATRQIRKFNKDVIIIAQTAYAFVAEREKAIEAGCNDYIAKPFKQATLIALLKKYF
jgi:PAS domain S-box-containing protein